MNQVRKNNLILERFYKDLKYSMIVSLWFAYSESSINFIMLPFISLFDETISDDKLPSWILRIRQTGGEGLIPSRINFKIIEVLKLIHLINKKLFYYKYLIILKQVICMFRSISLSIEFIDYEINNKSYSSVLALISWSIITGILMIVWFFTKCILKKLIQ